jgi:RNA polymerase sigma-70 factor (ECF subfamily)
VVDLDGWLAFLAQRLPADVDPAAGLGRLKTGDLYLAYACLTGAAGAAEAFGHAYGPMLDRALAGVTAEASQIDDVKQAVFQKLFVPAREVDPAIHKYDGVGELRSWVRVTAVRMALNLHRERKRERPLSPELLLTRSDGRIGPEEDYLKRVYSDAFKQAFESALGALSHAQRNLLRYYYLDGLTVEQIGRMYRVHKATISRRLADVREHLLTETRNALVRQLDVKHSEVDSIMRMIHSRMDASICRYLDPERAR